METEEKWRFFCNKYLKNKKFILAKDLFLW